MREANLTCPSCGKGVAVFDDEIGQTGECPDCGFEFEVTDEAFGAAAEGAVDEEGLLELLADSPETAFELSSLPGTKTLDDSEAELDSDLVAMDLPEAEGAEEQSAPERPPAWRPGGATAQELDFRLWQGVAEQAGDWAMAVRLDAWRRAAQAGCEMTLDVPELGAMPVQQMVLSEAAVAAFQSQTEAEWRNEWTRRLLNVTAKWQDEATSAGVVAILAYTGPAIEQLRGAGVWPWPKD